MATKITPEAVKERIAALESAGEISLKEQFYLEALRQLVAGMDSEPVYQCQFYHTAASGELEFHWEDVNQDFYEQWDSERRGDRRMLYRGTAVLQAQSVCTCPSGDGSLRWPCPVHTGNSPVVPDGIERVASMAEYLGNFAAAAIIRQLAANQPQNAQQNIPEIIPDSCTWTFSNYDDHWSGACGVEWIFPDGGPEENGVKFCPKCGKSVAVSATEGTEG